MKSKLSSRKLWAAAAGLITGLALIFGLDKEFITVVAGTVTSVASVIAYIVTEGKIDMAHLNKDEAVQYAESQGNNESN